MTEVKLKKRWNNHEAGITLKSVSPRILKELEKGNFADKPKKKEVSKPPSNKAVPSSPSTK